MQQLKLLAQPPTPQYKAGDWVKTKRKPAVAAHVKRGEIFQVSAVHPINGSMKFHNPHINEWDYLYPDEVKACPAPSNVESVVENLESISTVESVVENLSTTSGWLDFHYKIRIDGKQHSNRRKQNKSTGPYYIYRWLEGKKQRAKYVPAKKKGEVYRAIAMNRPVAEILKIISSPNRLDAILKK